MSQSLPAVSEDDEDEPTLSYTHSEIQRMREPVVRLADFAEFGDGGTPAGMIGSRNAASLMLVGVCGEVEDDERAHFGPMGEPVGPVVWGPPRAANSPVDEDTPTARGEASGWPSAQAETAAPPLIGEDEGSVASRMSDDTDDDAFVAQIRGHRKVLLVTGCVLGLLLAAMLVWPSRETAEAPGAQAEYALVDEAAPGPAENKAPSPKPDVEEAPGTESPGGDNGQSKVPEAPPLSDKSKPKRAAWETAACGGKRRTAKQAKQLGNWRSVENATRSKPECWRNKNEHKALRMEALFELGRLDECVKLGKSGNKRVKTLQKRCKLAQK